MSPTYPGMSNARPLLPTLISALALCANCSSTAHAPSSHVAESPHTDEGTEASAIGVFPPPAMQKSPATKLRSLRKGDDCYYAPDDVRNYEHQRLAAALDAVMRKEGGYVLPTTIGPPLETQPMQLGDTMDGESGEPLMVIGTYNSCSTGRVLPFVVSADGGISAVVVTAKATKTTDVNLCRPHCPGCGPQAPDLPVLAEVPEGSFLAPVRRIEVPIDVQLNFTSNKVCEPMS